jgi:hypothetical protein
LAVFSARLESIFLGHYQRFYDALSYDSQNANVYLDQKKNGQLTAIAHELRANNRDIFRTLPLIIFAPNLLAKQYGQYATSLPLLFTFAFFLSWESYRRSRSICFSVFALIVFFTLPGLTHPIYGYAANWLDMPAAMAMGTSVLALLRFIEARSLKWLFVFGLFASITAMCRWSAATYLAFYGCPVLLLAIFRYLRHKGNLKTAIAILTIAAGPGVCFVTYNIPSTYEYYSTVCFGMGSTIEQAVDCTVQGLQSICGSVTLGLLGVLIARIVLYLIAMRASTEKVLNSSCSIWFPLSLTVLLCLILKSAQAIHPMVYIVPALFVAAFANDLSSKISDSHLFKLLVIVLSFTLIYQSGQNYRFLVKMAKNPPPELEAAKRLDLTLAHYMAVHKIQTYSEYDDERSMATMDCFYESRWKPDFRGKSFSIHEPYFKAWYPKKSPLEVSQKIFEDNNRDVDLLLVHDSVLDVPRNVAMRNPFSLTISSFMTEHVRQSPTWKKVDVWLGPYGPMGVYTNKSRVANYTE